MHNTRETQQKLVQYTKGGLLSGCVASRALIIFSTDFFHYLPILKVSKPKKEKTLKSFQFYANKRRFQ